MALTNCGRCGNLFNSEHAENVCQACVIAEQADLRKVTAYLREHPLANVMEVHENTKVDRVMILRFVKSGNLKVTNNADKFKCRLCGRPITKGRLCAGCEARVHEGIDGKG
ncbi:MAG: hypothetical protein LLG37_03280 [Spirochaetia bacterium]|nr:hypothetical protein [Spirochaetia bacterium]